MLNNSLTKTHTTSAVPSSAAQDSYHVAKQCAEAEITPAQAAIMERYIRENLTVSVEDLNSGYSLVRLQISIKLKGNVISSSTVSFTT